MLRWALIFLVIAIIAGLFGFRGVASTSAGISKVLLVIAAIVVVLGLIFASSLF